MGAKIRQHFEISVVKGVKVAFVEMLCVERLLATKPCVRGRAGADGKGRR